jgi:hypothetical protein
MTTRNLVARRSSPGDVVSSDDDDISASAQ